MWTVWKYALFQMSFPLHTHDTGTFPNPEIKQLLLTQLNAYGGHQNMYQ